uniref:Uncharacterized protein n=1 Tax=Moniliophthora roreri TaxID=221103 RepID=A0A0W0FPI4_MONRR
MFMFCVNTTPPTHCQHPRVHINMTKPKPSNPGHGHDWKWDEGPKSEYLNSLESLWRQKSTLFLDEVEKYFIKTWGYNLPVYDILDENTDYAPPDINMFPEDQCQEEADHRKDFKADL